jgi:ethanolamine utilization protein EutN
MFLGRVVGSIVSSAKHPTYAGQKLMIVRLTTPDGRMTPRMMVAVDAVGSGAGDFVLISSDGQGVSDILGYDTLIPIREIIVAIVDRVNL